MTKGTLKSTEPHPAVFIALNYIKSISSNELYELREALASCAIESNRLSEICIETLRRLIDKEPVSDRYILGLAWTIKEIKDLDQKLKERSNAR